ncbi:tigger transposable element-derived 1-like [Pelobates cultripes]|uniref:Tigger transposable element-derived 1-like n=1 Tax=Pelobates cultripes TaxID=61616 RepID=A0AAD1SW17_PELCU|nr:tigger transposable element-derived 1-like [Pelobates cultripes]
MQPRESPGSPSNGHLFWRSSKSCSCSGLNMKHSDRARNVSRCRLQGHQGVVRKVQDQILHLQRVRHGEVESSDVAAAEEFATKFLEVIVSEGYLAHQVFNCEETGLFWKRMPKCTFIKEEETSLPDHKPMKDRLTLLFCANASGDLKIKPLLVYHSEIPQAFKKHKVNKEQLSVLWR